MIDHDSTVALFVFSAGRPPSDLVKKRKIPFWINIQEPGFGVFKAFTLSRYYLALARPATATKRRM